MQVGVRRVKTVTRRGTRGSRYQRSTEPTLDYVAAELPKKDLPTTFTVGDGETLGNNENKPLESNTQYDIYLGSVSRISQSVSLEFYLLCYYYNSDKLTTCNNAPCADVCVLSDTLANKKSAGFSFWNSLINNIPLKTIRHTDRNVESLTSRQVLFRPNTTQILSY